MTDGLHTVGWDRCREEVDAQMACKSGLDSGHRLDGSGRSLVGTGPAERHIRFAEVLNRNRAQGEGTGSAKPLAAETGRDELRK